MTDHLQQIELLAGERQARESDAAVVACNDYLRLGIGRSLEKLRQNYAKLAPDDRPTIHLRWLKAWSARFDWQERASAYDAVIDQEKTALVDQRRKEVMESGLALAHERVIKLKRLAGDLEHQLYETDRYGHRTNLWVRDVKAIDKREVEIFRYNSALVSDYRGVLDDLAKETGGRKQQHEFGGPNGGPIRITTVDELSDDDLARIAAASGR